MVLNKQKSKIPTYLIVAFTIIFIITLGYAILTLHIFTWVFAIIVLGIFTFIMYMLYRLVIAVERIEEKL